MLTNELKFRHDIWWNSTSNCINILYRLEHFQRRSNFCFLFFEWIFIPFSIFCAWNSYIWHLFHYFLLFSRTNFDASDNKRFGFSMCERVAVCKRAVFCAHVIFGNAQTGEMKQPNHMIYRLLYSSCERFVTNSATF